MKTFLHLLDVDKVGLKAVSASGLLDAPGLMPGMSTTQSLSLMKEVDRLMPSKVGSKKDGKGQKTKTQGTPPAVPLAEKPPIERGQHYLEEALNYMQKASKFQLTIKGATAGEKMVEGLKQFSDKMSATWDELHTLVHVKKINTEDVYEKIRKEMEKEIAWFDREKPVILSMQP